MHKFFTDENILVLLFYLVSRNNSFNEREPDIFIKSFYEIQ